jgi:hypothetical protein
MTELSGDAKGKVPEFVKLVKSELEKSKVKVDEGTLEKALLKSQERLGCDVSCSSGMRW